MKNTRSFLITSLCLGITIASFASFSSKSEKALASASNLGNSEFVLSSLNNKRYPDSEVSVTSETVSFKNKNNQLVTGIELKSNNEYHKNIIVGNTSDANSVALAKDGTTTRSVDGYSMPYNQRLNLGLTHEIDMSHDVVFYMNPILAGTRDTSTNIRFGMALCDGDGEFTSRFNNGYEQGFTSSSKYISWEFSRSYYNDNTTYRSWDSITNYWSPTMYEKINTTSDAVKVGTLFENGKGNWLEEAFYGAKEHRLTGNGYDVSRFINTEQLVKTTIHFDLANQTFTLDFDHTYLDDLTYECTASVHDTDCHFRKTYNFSNIGFTSNSKLKLSFGYFDQSSCWTYSQMGSTEVARNEIPMSLHLYNFSNGSYDWENIVDFAFSNDNIRLNAGTRTPIDRICHCADFSGNPMTLSYTFEDSSYLSINDGYLVVAENVPNNYSTKITAFCDEISQQRTANIIINSNDTLNLLHMNVSDDGVSYFVNNTAFTVGDEVLLEWDVVESSTTDTYATKGAGDFSVLALESNSVDRGSITANSQRYDPTFSGKELRKLDNNKLPSLFFNAGTNVKIKYTPIVTSSFGNVQYTVQIFVNDSLVNTGTIMITVSGNNPKRFLGIAFQNIDFEFTINVRCSVSSKHKTEQNSNGWYKILDEVVDENKDLGITAKIKKGSSYSTDYYEVTLPFQKAYDLKVICEDKLYECGKRYNYVSFGKTLVDSLLDKNKVCVGYYINDLLYSNFETMDYPGNSITVKASTAVLNVSPGAAAYLVPGINGIKFSGCVDYDGSDCSEISYGIILGSFTQNESIERITLDNYDQMVGKKNIQLISSSNEDISETFNIEINGLENKEISERFTARTFLKIKYSSGETKTYYSKWSVDNIRSVYEIADKAIRSERYSDNDFVIERLYRYVNSVVELDYDGNLKGLQRDYTIAFKKDENELTGTLTISKINGLNFNIEDIGSIIYNGEILNNINWEKKGEKIVSKFDYSYFGGNATLWTTPQLLLQGPSMGYVWQTRSGKYVCIDSGLPNEFASQGSETNLIVDYLKEHAVEGVSKAGDEIIVDSWFITHGHGDHVGAVMDILENYDTYKIRVKNIYYNIPKDFSIWDKDSGSSQNDMNLTRRFIEAAKNHSDIFNTNIVDDVKVGSSYEIDGLKIKILFTYDDSINSNQINNSSMIIKVFSGKKNVIFLGDIDRLVGDKITNASYPYYSDFVDCDILQAAHHGNSQGDGLNLNKDEDANIAFSYLNTISPKIVLFACPEWMYWCNGTSDYTWSWINTQAAKRYFDGLGVGSYHYAFNEEVLR